MLDRANAIVTPERFSSLDSALKALKKQMLTNGTQAAMNRHAYYTKPGERRRLKSVKARKRARRAEKVRFVNFNQNASRDAIYKDKEKSA